jgi:hypothetical protein
MINKKYSSDKIHPLDGGSRILSALEIDIKINNIDKIRLINVYNPPKNFEALAELNNWLTKFKNRNITSFIFIDSNLHHKLWNPANYSHSHNEAKELIRICGRRGFKIISEKGIPTFSTKRSSSTTINLTWCNFSAQKLVQKCSTSHSNHGSDHQVIHLELNFSPQLIINKRSLYNLENINTEKFNKDFLSSLNSLENKPLTNQLEIDNFVTDLTSSFQHALNNQKKEVKNNSTKAKPWWDKKILDPLADKRNRAQRWMLLLRSTNSCNCYQHWQQVFRDKVYELKKNHWRKFLAECKDHEVFKAYKYTKPVNHGSVAPLLDDNNTLTSNKEEQANLLFKGTSDALINISLNNVSIPSFNLPLSFPEISTLELKTIISNLPNKKARGHDEIANEMI